MVVSVLLVYIKRIEGTTAKKRRCAFIMTYFAGKVSGSAQVGMRATRHLFRGDHIW